MKEGEERIVSDVQTKMAENEAVLLDKLEELRRNTQSQLDRLEALLQQQGGQT